MFLGSMKPETGSINRIPTIGVIMRAFKAKSSYLIRQNLPNFTVWQRNYYERVHEYIYLNPANPYSFADNVTYRILRSCLGSKFFFEKTNSVADDFLSSPSKHNEMI